jgi:hypothetical protein
MKLVIVGGCGSSGTTLLAHLLSRHPAVASGPEMNFFNHKEVLSLKELATHKNALFQRRRLTDGYMDVPTFLTPGKTFGIDQERLDEWVNRSNSLRELYESFADHLCAVHGTSLFVEKSPTNVYNFAAFTRLFPDVSLIHQIRDGRDVVVSLMARGKTLFQAGSRWLYDTVAGLGARGAPGYVETRYEELVSDSATTLKRIFRHLKIPFEAATLQNQPLTDKGIYIEHWLERASGRAWKQTPSDPISATSVGRYRESLTPEQLSTLYRIRLTKRATTRLGAPVSSFAELLHFLGYCNYETTTLTLKRQRRTTEWMWELRDYYRRARRYFHRGRRLPPRLTAIYH